MIEEIRKRTSWPLIDELMIEGDYRGRSVTAKYNNDSFHFFVTFGSSGQIREFREI